MKFNNEHFEGIEQVGKKIMDLPPMEFTVKSYDAVPVGEGALVHTGGVFEVEKDKPVTFSQSFVLQPKGDGHFIIAIQIF